MAGAEDPNLLVGKLAIAGIVLGLFWRLLAWIRDLPKTADPWDAETEKRLHEPDAVEICPHCLTAQEPDGWFCPKCNRATGPYNNLMPFINVFSEGEVLRNGASGKLRPTPLIVIGYILISFSLVFSFSGHAFFIGLVPAIFVPIYWFRLLKNFARQDEAVEEPEP